MSSGNRAPAPAPAPAPPAPTPQSAYYYSNNNGVNNLQSSSVYDKGQNAYTDTTYNTPQQTAINQNATNFISGLVSGIPNAFNQTPEQTQAYMDAYQQPQIDALNHSYDQAKGAAINAMNSAGLGNNSVGGDKYMADEIERNRAQGLADIAANAKLASYQLPSLALTPYADAFNIVSGALNGNQAQAFNQLQPATNTAQAANSFAASNYQNQLNQYQSNLNNQGFYQKFINQIYGV